VHVPDDAKICRKIFLKLAAPVPEIAPRTLPGHAVEEGGSHESGAHDFGLYRGWGGGGLRESDCAPRGRQKESVRLRALGARKVPHPVPERVSPTREREQWLDALLLDSGLRRVTSFGFNNTYFAVRDRSRARTSPCSDMQSDEGVSASGSVRAKRMTSETFVSESA